MARPASPPWQPWQLYSTDRNRPRRACAGSPQKGRSAAVWTVPVSVAPVAAAGPRPMVERAFRLQSATAAVSATAHAAM